MTSWSFRQGLFGLCMPSVFGIDDNYDLKPWEEGQAFQRSEQPQIQRGLMIHTPQGPQVFWWSFGWNIFSKRPSLVFVFSLFLNTFVVACVCVIQWHKHFRPIWLPWLFCPFLCLFFFFLKWYEHQMENSKSWEDFGAAMLNTLWHF